MNVRRTLDELGDLAVNEIGFCVGIHWRSVTGSRVPQGMVSARCRLAYVLFSGFAPAYRFHDLLARSGSDILPRRNIRPVQVAHAGQTITGVAVVAVVSPDSADPTGYRPAPPHRAQAGYHRFFRQRAESTVPAWWDEPDDQFADDRFADAFQPSRAELAERDDLGLEILLDQIEAEFDAKLWWYGAPGRRTKYPLALGSVAELFAYARRQEITPEEFARRNRERQTEQWLNEQHARDRARQQALAADQAEVAAALQTPRRGRAHAQDRAWLATEQTLRARKGLRHLYRDTAPPPAAPPRRIVTLRVAPAAHGIRRGPSYRVDMRLRGGEDGTRPRFGVAVALGRSLRQRG